MRISWLDRLRQFRSHRTDRRRARSATTRRPHAAESESLEPRLLLVASAVQQVTVPYIIDGTHTSDWPAVGKVGDADRNFCTGTLIDSRYVLTAAHCTDALADTDGRFQVGGEIYASARIYNHPDYMPKVSGTDEANDISIIELDRSVVGITPRPVSRTTPVVGESLTLVGFGFGGTADGGADGIYGQKRAGTTPIEDVSSTLVSWTFDGNGESNTARGDSGGPAFVEQNGEYLIAGVTSGGNVDETATGGRSFDTRVDAYQEWIDSVVRSAAPTPESSEWGHQTGGDQFDAGVAVAVDAQGNTITVGTIGMAGERESRSGDSDVVIEKRDRDGELLWSHTLQKVNPDPTDDYRSNVASGVDVDRDGNIYISGSFQDTLDFDPGTDGKIESSAGSYDAFLLKLNQDGEFVWVRTFGQSNGIWDTGKAVSVSNDGHVALTGAFGGRVNFNAAGNNTHQARGDEEGYVVVLDTDGNYEWSTTFGARGGTDENGQAISNSLEGGSAVEFNAQGVLYVAGRFEGDADLDTTTDYADGRDRIQARGNGDAFVAAFGAGGTLNWVTVAGSEGSRYEQIEDVTVAPDGRVVIGGRFQGREFVLGQRDAVSALHGFEGFVSVLDADSGQVEWVRYAKGIGQQSVRGVAVADDGTIYAGGTFEYSVDFNPERGLSSLLTSKGNDTGPYWEAGDGFVWALTDRGDFENVWQVAGTGQNLVSDVAAAADGSVSMTGFFSETVRLELGESDIELTGTPERTMFTARLVASRVNTPPGSMADSYSTQEDSELFVFAGSGVLANDPDLQDDVLTAALHQAPAHGSLILRGDGSFVYRPDPDFNGSDSFVYIASDGRGQSAPTRVTLTVTPVNDAPVAVNDEYTVSAGEELVVDDPGLLTNDSDVEGDVLSAVILQRPRHGVVELEIDGSFTYTPEPGFTGVDAFTYVASDGQLRSAPATVTINVERPAQSTIAFQPMYFDDAGQGFLDDELGPERQAAFEFAMQQLSRHFESSYEGQTIVVAAAMPRFRTEFNDLTAFADSIEVVQSDLRLGVPLYEQLAQQNINGTAPDAYVYFNSGIDDPNIGNADFYYGLDGAPGDDYDFASLAMRKLTHSLKLHSSFNADGTIHEGIASVWDLTLFNEDIDPYLQLSAAQRAEALTGRSGLSFVLSETAIDAGELPILYTPGDFDLQHSGMYLDPAFHSGALLTPFTSPGEVVRAASSIDLAVLTDFGWNVTDAVPEESPFMTRLAERRFASDESLNFSVTLPHFDATTGALAVQTFGAATLTIGAQAGSVSVETGSAVTAGRSIDGIAANTVTSVAVYGSENRDRLDLSGVSDTDFSNLASVLIDSGAGDDTIAGSQLEDSILAGSGHDSVSGQRGDDTIYGGDGNDVLTGNAGDDAILGQAGDDRLRGLSGNDLLRGGSGQDQIRGGSGADLIDGGEGNDRLLGGRGSDWLRAGQGIDWLNGGSQTDTLQGDSSVDQIRSRRGRRDEVVTSTEPWQLPARFAAIPSEPVSPVSMTAQETESDLTATTVEIPLPIPTHESPRDSLPSVNPEQVEAARQAMADESIHDTFADFAAWFSSLN